LSGMIRHMCTWSGVDLPSSISIARWRYKSLNTYSTIRLNFPYSFLLRYFGAITNWYLQSQRTCNKFFPSCIGSYSFNALKGLPGEWIYFISCGIGGTLPRPPLKVVAFCQS
jgi:hypothetical protein